MEGTKQPPPDVYTGIIPRRAKRMRSRRQNQRVSIFAGSWKPRFVCGSQAG